jgi:hypothetical protein
MTITITNVNDESPSDMALSAASAAENAAAGTDIGTLSTTDGDASGNAHVYSLVTDSGGATAYSGTDFALDSAVLEVGSSPSFNYESTTSYSVCVKVADGSNTAYVEAFTISITDVNDNSPDFPAGSTASASVEELSLTSVIEIVKAST